jgi:hypothetical protein
LLIFEIIQQAEDSFFTTAISEKNSENKCAGNAIRTLKVGNDTLGIYAAIDYRAN